MKKSKYKVTWGNSYSQEGLTKAEALKIAAELLNTYQNVIITKYEAWL